jgi:hypothetical protein
MDAAFVPSPHFHTQSIKTELILYEDSQYSCWKKKYFLDIRSSEILRMVNR